MGIRTRCLAARAALVAWWIFALLTPLAPAVALADSPRQIAYYPETGFWVRDTPWVAWLDAYEALGGVDVLGYPISRPYRVGPRWRQVYQQGVLEADPASGETRLVDVLDELSQAGLDGWLAARGVPRPDDGPQGDPAEAVRIRQGWLVDPAIAEAYRQRGAATILGLPASRPEAIGSTATQRFQRGVLQVARGGPDGSESPSIGQLASGELFRAAGRVPSAALTPEPAPPESAGIHSGLTRDARGRIEQVFGLSPEVAREVLYPVTKDRAVAPDYAPADLVAPAQFGVPGPQPVRAIIGDDLAAMQRAADGQLVAVSAYRSFDYQQGLFRDYAAAEAALGLDTITAEARAGRYSARPGHSQHQLGTAIDFNQVDDAFAATPLGRWLAEHAWEYGFVLSFPAGAEPETGYVYEPWHYRWVGRPLARYLWEQGYLEKAQGPDGYLETLWAFLEAEPAS